MSFLSPKPFSSFRFTETKKLWSSHYKLQSFSWFLGFFCFFNIISILFHSKSQHRSHPALELLIKTNNIPLETLSASMLRWRVSQTQKTFLITLSKKLVFHHKLCFFFLIPSELTTSKNIFYSFALLIIFPMWL